MFLRITFFSSALFEWLKNAVWCPVAKSVQCWVMSSSNLEVEVLPAVAPAHKSEVVINLWGAGCMQVEGSGLHKHALGLSESASRGTHWTTPILQGPIYVGPWRAAPHTESRPCAMRQDRLGNSPSIVERKRDFAFTQLQPPVLIQGRPHWVFNGLFPLLPNHHNHDS